MKKVDRKVILPWSKRRPRRGPVSIIREHYLRDDIPCRMKQCGICDQELSDTQCMLTDDLSHYLLPDVNIVERFHEVLEYPTLRGIIITQTASDNLKYSVSRTKFVRFMKSLSVPAKSSVHFPNEHQLETYVEQEPTETIDDWEQKLTILAAKWYYRHIEMLGLVDKVKLVLITEECKDYAEVLTSCPLIQISSLSEYLQSHHGSSSSIYELHQSLVAVQTETESKDEQVPKGQSSITGYTEYLSDDQLEEGVEKGSLVIGEISVSRFHRNEAFVKPLNSRIYTDIAMKPFAKQDVLIQGMVHRNRSIAGDIVYVQLLDRSEWKGVTRKLPSRDNDESHDESCDDPKPTGRVVGVWSRSDRDIIASFPEDSVFSNKMRKVLVIPYDIGIPKIRINTRLSNELKNHRIVVRFDDWDINSYYPNGHFVRGIGPIGDTETEIQAILIENELSTSSFTQSILSELPDGDSWKIEDEELRKRRDLRDSHLIYSIDPKGCEDVDDTLSVKSLRKGIQLGVHIADVSYFVKSGSYTDREAKQRSTTVYLADRRYDMLPAVLSSNLCSLLSNVDRYAVSVICTLDSHYEIKSIWHGRTIIRSAYKLTYEVAQDLYEDKDDGYIISLIPELSESKLTPPELAEKVSELRQSIKKLVEIARVLREKRNRNGALELEGVEVKIQMTDKDNIDDIIPKKPQEIHETVAECMIFANEWVARKISHQLPSKALLRSHGAPPQDMFSSLKECGSARGYIINTGSNLKLAQSLDNAVDESDPEVNKVLRMLATQSMIQALYTSTGSHHKLSHYGLGIERYTHFTSPIRRYADLLVHRQLLHVIDDVRPGDKIPDDSELQEICKHMNDKKRAAKFAQLESTALFQGLYFLNDSRAGTITEAIVYNIRANGVMAYSPRYGIHSPVYFKDKSGRLVISPKVDDPNTLHWTEGSVRFTDHRITVNTHHSSFTISLFDHILVSVKVDSTSPAHPHKISLELNQCTPIKLSTGDHQKEGKTTSKDIIKVLRSEEEARRDKDTSEMLSEEFKQQEHTLYTIINKMHHIGIRDY